MGFEDGGPLEQPEDNWEEQQRIEKNARTISAMLELGGDEGDVPKIYFQKVIKEDDVVKLEPEKYAGFIIGTAFEDADPHIVVANLKGWREHPEIEGRQYVEEPPAEGSVSQVMLRDMAEEIGIKYASPDYWQANPDE